MSDACTHENRSSWYVRWWEVHSGGASLRPLTEFIYIVSYLQMQQQNTEYSYVSPGLCSLGRPSCSI